MTTPRRMTVPSIWRGSAIFSPPSPCSWSRWLSAGSPGRNCARARVQKAAVRPMAASPLTTCRMAPCRKEIQGRPSILSQHARDHRPAYLGPWTQKSGDLGRSLQQEPSTSRPVTRRQHATVWAFDFAESLKSQIYFALDKYSSLSLSYSSSSHQRYKH